MIRHSAIQRFWISGVGSFFCWFVWQAAAQEPDETASTFRSDVRLVLLDVYVKDRESAVLGLSKENFVVREDGRPQKITVFDRNDLPVTVGILVDESRSMTSKRTDVLTAA